MIKTQGLNKRIFYQTRDKTPPENNEHTRRAVTWGPRLISYLEIIAQLKQRKQNVRQMHTIQLVLRGNS